MAKEFFKDLPNTTTPLNASRLNGLLDGEEAMGNLVVDSIKTKNIVPNNWLNDYRIASDGLPYYETGNSLSPFIKVKPSTTYVRNYTFDSVKPVALYDGSKTFIQRITSGSTFTTTSTTAYIRTAIPTSQKNSVQIEEGSTPTTFSANQDLNNDYDMGWVECRIASGFEHLSWNKLVYSKKNGIVSIMGAINTTATTSFGKNITTLPVGFRPLKEFDIVCRAGGEVVKVAITSTGEINVLDTSTGGNLNSGTGIFISATYIAWEG